MGLPDIGPTQKKYTYNSIVLLILTAKVGILFSTSRQSSTNRKSFTHLLQVVGQDVLSADEALPVAEAPGLVKAHRRGRRVHVLVLRILNTDQSVNQCKPV